MTERPAAGRPEAEPPDLADPADSDQPAGGGRPAAAELPGADTVDEPSGAGGDTPED